MSGYQYLTAEDQERIVAEERAARPTPEAIVRAAEEAHFRAVVRAKLGLNDVPDPFVPPDVADAEREHEELAKPIVGEPLVVAEGKV